MVMMSISDSIGPNQDFIDTVTQSFLTQLQTNGSRPETIRAYKQDLTGFVNWMNPALWVAPDFYEHLETQMSNYLNFNRATWAPRTVQRRLAAFRAYGLFHGAPASFLAGYRAPTAERQKPHPIPEGIDGVLRMLNVARNPQDKALVALCGLGGLRVSEATSVLPEHFFGIGMLTVQGKGDKTRVIPLSPAAHKNIGPALCIAQVHNTTLVNKTESGARKIITKLGRYAGLSQPVSSHDLRATFATAALKKSHDIRAVQELLGHASVKTTMIYTDVTEEDMRRAAEVV